MGSKRSMLSNGLGLILKQEACRVERFVDLFCGSAAVSWHVAERLARPVLAVDLQRFAVVLAESVIGRTKPCDRAAMGSWLVDCTSARERSSLWGKAMEVRASQASVGETVAAARDLCADGHSPGPIWRAYGGHYFSPCQALTLDFLLSHVPSGLEERNVALAAVIHSASKCVAAPGHTAQPLQPTPTAGSFLMEAWARDPLYYTAQALDDICPRHARRQGEAVVADAQAVAASLTGADLVFVDPPYSDVQYSRFYHVLETIARGGCGAVTGVGRYPPAEERPRSAYSLKSQSHGAISDLLLTLAQQQCTVIVTFPLDKASNGISGEEIAEIANEWYDVTTHKISSQFSTLGGGNNGNRKARQTKTEAILVLKP